MCWHSSDLRAKLTFETKLRALVVPVYSESFYFQFHFPSIHEWLIQVKSVDPHRQQEEIPQRRRQPGLTVASSTHQITACHHYSTHAFLQLLPNLIDMSPFLSFSENKTSKQTNETSGESVRLKQHDVTPSLPSPLRTLFSRYETGKPDWCFTAPETNAEFSVQTSSRWQNARTGR